MQIHLRIDGAGITANSTYKQFQNLDRIINDDLRIPCHLEARERGAVIRGPSLIQSLVFDQTLSKSEMTRVLEVLIEMDLQASITAKEDVASRGYEFITDLTIKEIESIISIIEAQKLQHITIAIL